MCFTFIIPFNPSNKAGFIIIPISQVQNWGLEVNQMLKITQVMCVLVEIQDQVQPISEYELLVVFYKVK